jgi:hypothetical protein
MLRPQVESRGYRWYALLAPFEQEEFSKRLPGRWSEVAKYREVTLWKLE